MPSPVPASNTINERKLTLIRVARRQLRLEDDDYRRILVIYGGVEHSKDLTQEGFTAVMARFAAIDFKSTSDRRPYPVRIGMPSPAQTQLMRQMWADFTNNEGTDATLGKWLEAKFKVSALRFVPADLAPKVIAGLRAMCDRRLSKRINAR